mgnify:CR=1 FL=1
MRSFSASFNGTQVCQQVAVLFDEIDAVATTRDDAHDVGELKRVVNSLLQAMDPFVAKDSILVGASNHQYMLDPAIWRRFDDVITFPKPSPAIRCKYICQQLTYADINEQLVYLKKMMSAKNRDSGPRDE